MSKVAAAGVVIALTLGIAIGYLLLPMIFPVNTQSTSQILFIRNENTIQINNSYYIYLSS